MPQPPPDRASLRPVILRRVKLGSTAKVAAGFAVLMVLLVAVVAAVLYAVGAGLGVVADIDRVAKRVFNDAHFHLTAVMFIAGAVGAAVVLGIVGVALAVVAASIYNRLAVLTGGVQARLPGAGSREALPSRRQAALQGQAGQQGYPGPRGRPYPGVRDGSPAPVTGGPEPEPAPVWRG